MKGFGRNGSLAEEEAGGVGAVAAAELDCSTVFSSEVSSSFRPAKDAGNSRLQAAVDDEREALGGGEEEEGEDELELGLSLGAKKVSGNGGGAVRSAAAGGGGSPWGEYCRILTAKDFPSIVASRGSPISSSSSTASSSPSLGGGGGGVGRAAVGVAGTKRAAADSVAPEVGSRPPSQVVGWPPIRAYRMNNLMNQSRDNSEMNNSNKNNGGSVHHDKATGHSSSILRNTTKENVARKEHEKKGSLGGSPFVKVNMDGMPIGRKVDLNAHHRYETLALALEDMFQNTSSNTIRTARTSSLLDGSSEFVLTYEDKDGDWMLVGDVPWGMFLSTVRRLRIMRTSDATGLGTRCQTSKVGGLRKNHV